MSETKPIGGDMTDNGLLSVLGDIPSNAEI